MAFGAKIVLTVLLATLVANLVLANPSQSRYRQKTSEHFLQASSQGMLVIICTHAYRCMHFYAILVSGSLEFILMIIS